VSARDTLYKLSRIERHQAEIRNAVAMLKRLTEDLRGQHRGLIEDLDQQLRIEPSTDDATRRAGEAILGYWRPVYAAERRGDRPPGHGEVA
jgi:ketosteroid isomerase-like protein